MPGGKGSCIRQQSTYSSFSYQINSIIQATAPAPVVTADMEVSKQLHEYYDEHCFYYLRLGQKHWYIHFTVNIFGLPGDKRVVPSVNRNAESKFNILSTWIYTTF